MRRWLAVLLLVPGCAFALSGPDPDRPRNQVPRCDTTKNLVVLDGVMATALGVVALSLVTADESAVALLPAAVGALYVGGAIRGNNNVNACRAEIDNYTMAMGQRPVLPDESRDAEMPLATAPMSPAMVNPPPGPPPVAQPPVAQPPIAQPPVAQQPVTPVAQPPIAQPPIAQPPPKMPRPRPAPRDDEWGEFWKEVP